jgi:hypothetical protein
MANKLLVIANPFPPSGPIGWSVRARKWCQYLPRHGWEPTVLTGPFHYQVKCPPLDSVQVVGKASDALSRPIPRWAFLQRLQKYAVPDPYVLRWLPLAVANGRSLIRQKNFDAILSSSPVNTCHLVALALHRQTMKPWIADFRDPWVGNSRVTRPAWAEWLNERQEAMVVRRSTVVTCAAAAHLEQLRQGYPECAGKLVFLPNGFDPTDFLEVEPICPSDAAFNLLHAGHISGWRRALLSPLFEALTKLPTDIRMWFIGETKSAEVEDQIRRFRLEARVTATTGLPHKEAMGWCRGADLLILIEGAPYSIPGKLYEYLAAGRPILHVGPESCAAGKQLAEWRVGRSAQSVEEIISAILQARRDNSSGSSFYPIELGRYSRQQLTAELAGHLNQVIRRELDAP